MSEPGQHEPDGSIHPETLESIEAFSIVFEQFGFPRMAGRIFALLLLKEEPTLTQAEIADALRASTGSVSTMTRLLEQIGFVQRVSVPGQRRDRFRLTPDPLVEMSKRRLEGAIVMIDIAERAKNSKHIGPIATGRLERSAAFYRWFHVEMELALMRWLDANPLPDED